MKLSIPFFSQLDSEVPRELQRSVCSIACVKMILDSRSIENYFENIYKEAEVIGGREVSGWSHETMVRLLRNHGVAAYRQEFFGHTINLNTLDVSHSVYSEKLEADGFEKIKKTIEGGNPVIVSVFAGFSQDTQNKKSINMVNHIVLLTGFDDDYLYVHDPIFNSSTKVTHWHFMNYWRRLAVFVE